MSEDHLITGILANRPRAKTTTVITKEVSFTLEQPEIESALKEYLTRNYAEFRNMELEFSFNGAYSDFTFKNIDVCAKRVTNREE